MKNNFLIWCPIILLCFCFAECKKSSNPADQLPHATQTGANTFGCLVNGKVFVPQSNCFFLCSPPLEFYFDNSNGGQFGVKAENENLKETITFGLDTCNIAKRYSYYINPNYPVRFSFTPSNGICDLSTRLDTQVIANGFVDITRFDLLNGVISGTFEFTLSKSGCETKNITNGRFDAKL